MPFFSIITCTKNTARFLGNNLNSLANQSFRDFEHIIIDGKSSDDTIALARKYPTKIFSQEPKGISSAMNLGIQKVSGKYLLHLHSDDWLHDKHVLRNVHKYLTLNPSLDWIYGQIETTEANGTPIGIWPHHKIFQLASPLLLQFNNYIPHQAVFIKKAIFDKFGDFDSRLSSSQDYDLWLRIARKTKWKFFNRKISFYRVRAGAQSSDLKNKSINQENLKKVQQRHNPRILLPLITTCTYLEDRFNKVLR